MTTGATSTFIATTTVNFTEETIPGASDCTSYDIQCISYTYDANGSITKIVENASTSAARTVEYTYDDLNRLTSAVSSNVASGSNYSHTYSYNAIGNLLSGPAGTYSYAHASSSYANPHALLSLTNGTTTTYAYDTNGNLTDASIGTSTTAGYTWDYRNRLANASSSNATSSYAYDSLGQRIKQVNGTSTTIYPTTGYNVNASSTVKQIMANGIMVATVDHTTSTVTRYVLNDHLGGTNLVTDDANTIIQTIDFLPYGARRINVGTDVSQREFIGQIYDEITQLSYLNARYYNANQGQFISEDPIFWSSKQNLANPQSLNSYSYANGNPISLSDPTGLATTIQQQIQILQLQINILQGILNLYSSGSTKDADRAYSAYQAAFGGDGSQSKQIKYPADAGRGIFSGGGTTAIPNITTPFRATMEANSKDPLRKSSPYFFFKEKNKGDWDLKNTSDYSSRQYSDGFIFNNEHIDSDAPGNIHYGYVGASADWAPGQLLVYAGIAQIIAGNSQTTHQNLNFFGDDPVDQINILWGVSLYYNR